MSIFREQRRRVGRWILSQGRKFREFLFGKPNFSFQYHFPKKVLVIRPFFLGDILLCLPVAQAIKTKFPNTQISWLLREEWTDLVKHHSVVDQVIPFSQSKLYGWKSIGEWFRIAKFLRQNSFDLIINLSWDRSTLLWTWISGARFKIGIEEFGRPRLLSLIYHSTVIAPDRSQDSRHMADFYFEPMKILGWEKRPEDPRVYPTEEESERVELQISMTLQHLPFLLIHPGGRLSNKRWNPSSFHSLIQRLAEQRTEPIILVCGPGEESWAANLAESLPPGKGLFWPATSLGEFMALAKRAKLFIGNDSGPMHLAAAAGCPVLALFGKPSLRWKPLGEKSRVIENTGGLDQISVDEVWNGIQKGLSA